MRARPDLREAFLTALASQITDGRVLEAFGAVDRSTFVLPEHAEDAWRNDPLSIGRHQTISQPMLVATMCALLRLRGHERVLDVGTGSGYHAALLGRLTHRVISIERHASLAERARRNLDAAGIDNVTVVVGDGSRGPSSGCALRRHQRGRRRVERGTGSARAPARRRRLDGVADRGSAAAARAAPAQRPRPARDRPWPRALRAAGEEAQLVMR